MIDDNEKNLLKQHFFKYNKNYVDELSESIFSQKNLLDVIIYVL